MKGKSNMLKRLIVGIVVCAAAISGLVFGVSQVQASDVTVKLNVEANELLDLLSPIGEEVVINKPEIKLELGFRNIEIIEIHHTDGLMHTEEVEISIIPDYTRKHFDLVLPGIGEHNLRIVGYGNEGTIIERQIRIIHDPQYEIPNTGVGTVVIGGITLGTVDSTIMIAVVVLAIIAFIIFLIVRRRKERKAEEKTATRKKKPVKR